MADPIPTTTVYITSDNTPVRTKNDWLSRELFLLLNRRLPELSNTDLKKITDLLGGNYDRVKTLIDQVEATP